MLPSASLGTEIGGKRAALYEPVHGSAPDIAGLGIANPIATVLSAAMLLRYSFAMHAQADKIEAAINTALAQNLRTGDIMQDGAQKIGTVAMGDAILVALGGQNAQQEIA
jgi:3-isopropylmalate dehydrogenase